MALTTTLFNVFNLLYLPYSSRKLNSLLLKAIEIKRILRKINQKLIGNKKAELFFLETPWKINSLTDDKNPSTSSTTIVLHFICVSTHYSSFFSKASQKSSMGSFLNSNIQTFFSQKMVFATSSIWLLHKLKKGQLYRP